MIAQVGMAVNRVAAMPITLREIAMGDMAWVTGVALTARGAVTPHSDAHLPTTTLTHKPHPGLPQGEGVHHNLLKHNGNELPPLGEGWGGAPNKQLFFYRQRRIFFTANGRFFYRRGGCRHARHDGGDGGDGKEENSFSDCRHRHPRQGEADSHSHGFLYLYQPIIEVSINGFTPQSALRKQQQLCRSCVSPAQGCGRSTLPWVTAPTNLATL